ncbi:MAG: type IV pilus biogenesis/stability protein PilW [Luteimonas sp.]
MRRSDTAQVLFWSAGSLLAGLVMVGCSRLTFVKPSAERGGYTQVAPDYDVREDKQERGRTLALEQVAAAGDSLRDGRLDQAELQARAALKNDAKSADAYTILALLAEQQGQAAEAGKHYAKAAELAPTRGTTLNNYGAWLCRNGRAAESLKLFERALADPSYSTPAAALSNAGTCALQAGQPALADRALRGALEFDPDNAVALAGLAQSSFDSGNYLQARGFSQRRLAVAPATPQVLQLASQIEQKLGDFKASTRYVERLGAEFPQSQAPRGESQP